jgi:exodeoxyribonuclease I
MGVSEAQVVAWAAGCLDVLMKFVFYDTETTGTDTTFDQILQFAAIQIDADFNELDRFDIRCRLLPHVIPAPGALLATRVAPAMLEDPSLPSHYEAMRQISEKLNAWSPAVFVGYNTLAFDEPLLRQAFFQTLQPIYLTNTNGNKRADVLRLVHTAAVLMPNAIAVPLSDKGKQSFRLDGLAPANGFAHENAHDALADVEATIYMARLVCERAPSVWNALMPLVDKQEVTARVLSDRPNCLVEFFYGQPSVRPVVGCGQSIDNPTMLGVFDLTYDPAAILDADVDGLVAAMTGSDRSIRIVYANRMPAVVDLSITPNGAFDTPLDLINDRARRIIGDRAFQQRVGEALAARYPPTEAAEIVEQRIHDGFPSKADQRRMADFHDATWEERTRLVETFEDERLRELGRRLIFLEEPSALDPQSRDQLEGWLKNRRNGREGVKAGRTIADALEELDKLGNETADRATAVDEIKDWLSALGVSSLPILSGMPLPNA